ncbi:MAG: hypothetical protein Q9M21_03610 [Mariprofundaceae bacterium]|nr:hypothetical protein [Mariprofundaceae bacterium]
MQDSLNMAIQRYRHVLAQLQDIIESKKWEKLPKSQAMLDQASDTLRSHLEQGAVEQRIQNDLMQLSLQHRRVTRQLNQHMQRVQEALQYVEKGLNKVRYMSEFTENNLQTSS